MALTRETSEGALASDPVRPKGRSPLSERLANARPYGARVLIEPVDWNRVWLSDGGVWVNEKGTPVTQGKVIALGPTVTEPALKAGVYVVFIPNQYQFITPQYWTVHQDVCLGTLEVDEEDARRGSASDAPTVRGDSA